MKLKDRLEAFYNRRDKLLSVNPIEGLKESFADKGCEKFHADWTAKGRALPAEQKAKILLDIQLETSHPIRDLSGRLRGEAMMKKDSDHIRTNLLTGEKEPETREHRQAQRDLDNFISAADLLDECQELLDSLLDNTKK